jgi:hypothetical protein
MLLSEAEDKIINRSYPQRAEILLLRLVLLYKTGFYLYLLFIQARNGFKNILFGTTKRNFQIVYKFHTEFIAGSNG